MPSWDIFEQQTQEYRDSVLPPAVTARVAIEQASTFGWERYVGPRGRVIGMQTFGASAPLKELQKKFGFEPAKRGRGREGSARAQSEPALARVRRGDVARRGDRALAADRVPVEPYFRHADYGEFKLSPSGKYVAGIVRVNGRSGPGRRSTSPPVSLGQVAATVAAATSDGSHGSTTTRHRVHRDRPRGRPGSAARGAGFTR